MTSLCMTETNCSNAEDDGGILRWSDQGVRDGLLTRRWTSRPTAIDLEFLPTDTNEEKRSVKPEVCAAADAHSIHGSHEL